MKEILKLIKTFDLKGLLITPTCNSLLQFFRYAFVGGIATVVDWGVMLLFTGLLDVHYLISAVFAFAAGLLTNFYLSRLLVFKAFGKKYTIGIEFLGFAFIGVVGLGLTECILFFLTKYLYTHYMIAKMLATFVVLFWNYFSRRFILYYKA